MRFSCNHYQIMNNQLVKISKWILGNTLYNKPIFFVETFRRFQYLFNFFFYQISINQFYYHPNYYNSEKIYLQ